MTSKQRNSIAQSRFGRFLVGSKERIWGAAYPHRRDAVAASQVFPGNACRPQSMPHHQSIAQCHCPGVPGTRPRQIHQDFTFHHNTRHYLIDRSANSRWVMPNLAFI